MSATRETLEQEARMLRRRINELRIDFPEAADARRDQLARLEDEIRALRASGASS